MSEKLLRLFKVDNYFRLLIIFTVFGITGSLSVILGKYVLISIFSSKILENEFYWLIRILLDFSFVSNFIDNCWYFIRRI